MLFVRAACCTLQKGGLCIGLCSSGLCIGYVMITTQVQHRRRRRHSSHVTSHQHIVTASSQQLPSAAFYTYIRTSFRRGVSETTLPRLGVSLGEADAHPPPLPCRVAIATCPRRLLPVLLRNFRLPNVDRLRPAPRPVESRDGHVIASDNPFHKRGHFVNDTLDCDN